MKTLKRVVVVLALIGLCGSGASAAQDAGLYGTHAQLPQAREPVPGASMLAALGNFVFIPVRVAWTTIGAGLGGLTGFMTAGNHDAASDVWGMFEGQNILTPDVVQGKEPLQFGSYEAQLILINP